MALASIALRAAVALLPWLSASAQNETLHYSINWPSGLSLGEGSMTARRTAGQLQIELALEATVPGFPIRDVFRSTATSSFCSITFEKDSSRGKKKTLERSDFDAARGVLVRETIGGGKSERPIPSCARDALTFLYFLRRELADGRVPSSQTIFFGAPYQIRLQLAGTKFVTAGETRIEADRLNVMIKGPASEITFEISFARDDVRTPLQIKLPLALGLFSMDLAP